MADSLVAGSVAPSPTTGKRRRPAWLPAAAALFFALLTAWLGLWQLGRAEEKRARQAAYDAAASLPVVELASAAGDWRDLYYRRVRVSGMLDATRQVYLDNRVHQGKAGFHVVAPLDFGTGAVLVNRGWLPASADRTVAPHVPPPAGRQTVTGVLVPAHSRYVELSAEGVQGRVWQNLDLERYRAWHGAAIRDALILADATGPDALIRDWPRPDAGVERHVSYAVQWFSLTLAILILYGYHGIWRRLRATS